MARTPMYDPLTSEARSPWLAGLTEACYKLSSILDLETDELFDYPLSPVDDKRRIYQASLGNKLWLDNPEPVVKKNGIVITPTTDNFTINYLGGSVEFDVGPLLTENDFITVDATYIVDSSTTISNILKSIEDIAKSSSNFKGYFQTYEVMISSLGAGSIGNYAIVGGEDNSIYIWNTTTKKWENTFKTTDLSDYYKKLEIDGLLGQKENKISNAVPVTGYSTKDYYFGGDKSWVNIFDKVKSVTLSGLNTETTGKIEDTDSVISAFGKLQAQINGYVHDLFASGHPTTETVGEIGQDYTDTSNGDKFHLTAIEDGDYQWTQYGDVLGIKFSLTISTAGWTEKTNTISNTKLLSDEKYIYFITPYATSKKSYAENNVNPNDITVNGSITFICDDVPTEDLTVTIVRLELTN